MGDFGVVEECIVGEEMAFGCSGITTAVGGTNLGVSFLIIQPNYPWFWSMGSQRALGFSIILPL